MAAFERRMNLRRCCMQESVVSLRIKRLTKAREVAKQWPSREQVGVICRREALFFLPHEEDDGKVVEGRKHEGSNNSASPCLHPRTLS